MTRMYPVNFGQYYESSEDTVLDRTVRKRASRYDDDALIAAPQTARKAETQTVALPQQLSVRAGTRTRGPWTRPCYGLDEMRRADDGPGMGWFFAGVSEACPKFMRQGGLEGLGRRIYSAIPSCARAALQVSLEVEAVPVIRVIAILPILYLYEVHDFFPCNMSVPMTIHLSILG